MCLAALFPRYLLQKGITFLLHALLQLVADDLHQYPDTNPIFLLVLCHGDETQSFLLVDVKKKEKV